METRPSLSTFRYRSFLPMAVLAVCVYVTGCAPLITAPTTPNIAGAFSGVSAPLDIEFDRTKIGPAKGTSETSSVLWLFSWGDASIRAAAKEGNLVEVSHVDYKFTNILGVIYTNMKVTAHGYRDTPAPSSSESGYTPPGG